MKQIKVMMIAIMVMIGVGFTSCMESEEYTPQGVGTVEVISYLGLTYFKDLSGVEIHPTSSSLAAMESQYKFNSSGTRIAYILYEFSNEGNENMAASKKITNAVLKYAVSLDGTVEEVSEAGNPNDSITTAPIISIDNLSTTTGEEGFFIINDRYIFAGINYFYQKKSHQFTLVYYSTEQEEGKLKLHLRHSGTPEDNNVTTNSMQVSNSYYAPQIYMKSFDLNRLPISLDDGMTIEIETDINPYNNKLDDANNTKKKTYTIVYKRTEN